MCQLYKLVLYLCLLDKKTTDFYEKAIIKNIIEFCINTLNFLIPRLAEPCPIFYK